MNHVCRYFFIGVIPRLMPSSDADWLRIKTPMNSYRDLDFLVPRATFSTLYMTAFLPHLGGVRIYLLWRLLITRLHLLCKKDSD